MGNYIVSARKYRPTGFEEVVGQDHITTTLTNAIKHGTRSGAAVAKVEVNKSLNDVSIIIRNTINFKDKDNMKSTQLTSGQGKGLIESLLPPRGTYLKYKKSGNAMEVTLTLEAPYTIILKELKKTVFAVN